MEKELKTLETRAHEYAYPVAKTLYRQGFVKETWLENVVADGYMAGHEAAIKNQWRDATDYPPIDEDVLVDYPYEHEYVVAYYDGEDWYITETGRLIRPTHWMSIPPHNKTEGNE